MRCCTKCGQEKPETEFYKSANKAGLRPDCKVCCRQHAAEWSKRNPERKRATNRAVALKHAERIREANLQRRFGLSLEEYNALLTKQGGACAICGDKIGDRARKRLFVDHNHETGTVRGLLCSQCNNGIGLLRDSPTLLRQAAVYLEAAQNKKKMGRYPNRYRPFLHLRCLLGCCALLSDLGLAEELQLRVIEGGEPGALHVPAQHVAKR